MAPSSGRSCATDGASARASGEPPLSTNSMSAQQHNGANAAGQQAALNVVDMAQALNVGKVAHHNGKRLVAAAFAAAKLGYRLLVGGVACQVESRPGP